MAVNRPCRLTEMKKSRVHRLFIRFGLVALAIVGCSQRPKDMPKLFPCTIKVVNKSASIPGVRVQLLPGKDASLLPAVPISMVGTTAANGVAILYTNRLGAGYHEKGVPVGTYLVSVEKTPGWSGMKTAEEIQQMTGEQVLAYQDELFKAMESLPREVPKSLSRDEKQPIEIVEGKGGTLTIDVSLFSE